MIVLDFLEVRYVRSFSVPELRAYNKTLVLCNSQRFVEKKDKIMLHKNETVSDFCLQSCHYSPVRNVAVNIVRSYIAHNLYMISHGKLHHLVYSFSIFRLFFPDQSHAGSKAYPWNMGYGSEVRLHLYKHIIASGWIRGACNCESVMLLLYFKKICFKKKRYILLAKIS